MTPVPAKKAPAKKAAARKRAAPRAAPASPELLASVIRTGVPMAVGFLVTWLASKGVNLPTSIASQLASVLTILVGVVYYAIVRAIEKKVPQVGWLLGVAKAPAYPPTAQPLRNAKG